MIAVCVTVMDSGAGLSIIGRKFNVLSVDTVLSWRLLLVRHSSTSFQSCLHSSGSAEGRM